MTETISPEIVEFQKIEDSWSDAVNRRDQYSLELVLSPLFVDVSASGDVTTRNQQVALVISGDDKTLYLTQKVVTVRMLGDIAVANGTYNLHHKVGSAQVDEKGIFTQVFERVHGGWLCINSQRTVLRQDAEQERRHPRRNRHSTCRTRSRGATRGRSRGQARVWNRHALRRSSVSGRCAALVTARPLPRPGWGTGARTW